MEAIDDIKVESTEKNIEHLASEWETTFDSINDMISIHDNNLRLVKVNKKFAEVFKKKPEELIGKLCYEVFHEKGVKIANCPYKRMQESKKPVKIEYYETKLEMDLEVTAAPLINNKGDVIGCVHIARDIGVKKHAEENMMLTERLASMGELVAGIAHEVNNLLTSIIGYLELIMGEEVAEKIREEIAIAHHETMKAATAVGSLLSFARKHETKRRPVNLNGIIATVLGLRSYEHKVHNIKVITKFDRNMPMTVADSFQIQQVFLNIIINAEYFMIEAHNEGTLTITTECTESAIKVSFTDDGPGIPEKSLGRIFEPFFTTKEDGRGTGLGLSICQGIIDRHEGKIHVVSEKGKGARFIVEIPITTCE